MSLPSQLRRLKEQRARCAPLVAQLKNWKTETVRQCNICGSEDIVVITREDRYALPVRSGLCRNCGLIFLVDRFSTEDYGRFYQEFYRPLVSRRVSREQNPQTLQNEQRQYGDAMLRAFDGFLPLSQGASFLDIGGSTGVIADRFRDKYGVRATVLDPSPDELEVAKSNGHEIVCGLLETWEGDGRQFDLILCGRTIDHFLDLKGSLRKMHKLCKPDGYMLIDIIDVEAIRQNRGILEGAIKVDHCYYLSSEVAPAILAVGGWEVLKTEIVSHPERVTYLCKPITPVEDAPAPAAWITARLRDLQRNSMTALMAQSEVAALAPASPILKLKRKLAPLKKKFLGGK